MRIFDRALDTLPRLRRAAAGELGANTLLRLDRVFAARSVTERTAIMRGYLRHRLLNRVIYRLSVHAPAYAAVASRLVALRGIEHLTRALEHNGPVIIAPAHFGSLYFQAFVVLRFLRGRRVYMMHERRFSDGKRDEAFLRNRGIVPVGADARGLRTLVRALDEGARTAIVLPFDSPAGNRHILAFLGAAIPVSTGIGFLADIGNCAIVPWFWQSEHGRPSVFISECLQVDRTLPADRRRIAIVERLYALLEPRVARFPDQWYLDFIRDATVVTRRPIARVP